MKPVVTLILFILIALRTPGAPSYEVEWEISATDLMPDTVQISDITELTDGVVCVLTRKSGDIPGVLLLNPDGTDIASLWVTGVGSSYETEIAGGLTSEAFAIIYNYEDFYLFGVSNGVLSATQIDSEFSNNPYATSLGARGQYNRSSAYFYAYNELAIKKIRILPEGANVVGDVRMGVNDQNFVVSWDSKMGVSYQVQSSPDLTSWTDEGGNIGGNGQTLQWSSQVVTNQSYYRVIID